MHADHLGLPLGLEAPVMTPNRVIFLFSFSFFLSADLGDLVGVCLHARGVHLVIRQLLHSLTQPCKQAKLAFSYKTEQKASAASGHKVDPDTGVEASLVQERYCI